MKRKSLASLALLFVFVLTLSFVFTINVMADSEPAICCGIDATPYCTASTGHLELINGKDPGPPENYICVYTGQYDCEIPPICW